MVNNTTSVQSIVVNAAAVGTTTVETASSVKGTLGRTFTKIIETIKHAALKVKTVTVDFFKHFPTYIRSGYGVGAVGVVVGSSLALTAMCLNKDKNAAARVILILASTALFFTAGAVMFAFGKNPVTFARPGVIRA